MPRPRFTLRVFLLIVAAICGWLGWQASLVRERNGVLKDVQVHRGLISYHDKSELPLVRQYMGDTAADWIMIAPESPIELQLRIRTAFPRIQLNIVPQANIEMFRADRKERAAHAQP
jgi:hypothetical protein